jgi:hypothetical protein
MINYFSEFSNNQSPAINGEKILKRPAGTFMWICLAMLVFSLFGCAELNYRRLASEEVITSTQLRQNWNDFIVYYRPNAGLVYKIRNDKKIKLPGKWVAVAREERVTDSTVFYLTDVRKILGQNDDLYGYIVLPTRDSAFVKIINANTVELIYNHQVQRIGR